MQDLSACIICSSCLEIAVSSFWPPGAYRRLSVLLGCCDKVTVWVAYKQKIFCSGGTKSEVRVPVWSGEGPLLHQTSCILPW